MKHEPSPTKADKQYAAAYAAHYSDKELLRAAKLYEELILAHPSTPEAGYSRAQILNIVKELIPESDLLTARVKLIAAHSASSERVREQPSRIESRVEIGV